MVRCFVNRAPVLGRGPTRSPSRRRGKFWRKWVDALLRKGRRWLRRRGPSQIS